MIYVLIGLSLLFVAIGFTVTENNAKYLLAGYNTMPQAEQEQFDIKAYIPYFQKFHIRLGVSFLIIGVVLNYLVSENAGGIFLAVYPILAYIYFIWQNSKFYTAQYLKDNKTGFSVWAGTLLSTGPLIFVILVFSIGFKENKLLVHADSIKIEGSYGEILPIKTIKSISLTNKLPKITMRVNGFAAGNIRKGYFKTSEGEIIKLMLHKESKPFILITKNSGQKIYFSASGNTGKQVIKEIEQTWPNIIIK